MKQGKPIILLLTIFFAAVVVVFGRVELRKWNFPFSVEVISGNAKEELRCIEIDEEYYVFLPSYAEREKTHFLTNFLYRVYIDDQLLTAETTCADFPVNTKLKLYFRSLDHDGQRTVTILQSANVPTMYIDTASGQIDHIHAQKGNKESGTMRLYSVDGQLENMVVVESLQGRGNSTWKFSNKKPYSLRLSAETDLLGMGSANRWVLLANSFDGSHLKNKMVYDLAENAGMPYAPNGQWMDLYLNGSYAGLYLLSERNEIHPNRVDLPAESSFLVSWELEHRMLAQGYPYVKTERGTAIRVHQSALALEEIQNLWQSVENAVFAEDGIDPITGKPWDELIDLDSWAMLFLIDEISGDYDGGAISKFFYYSEQDGSGKIYAGPVWDKDDSLAKDHWTVSSPNAIIASRSYEKNGVEWRLFAGLYQKEAFSSRVTEIYQRTILPLMEELYMSGIEEYESQISQAAWVNGKRWNQEYTKESSLVIRDYIRKRMDFFDAYWIKKEEFCHIKVGDPYNSAYGEFTYGEFAVRPGEYLPELPQYEGFDWFAVDSDRPFDVSQPVYENVYIMLKALDDL